MNSESFNDDLMLHVLGDLDGAERLEIEARMATDDRLRVEAAALEEAMAAYTVATTPNVEPPPGLKKSIMLEIRNEQMQHAAAHNRSSGFPPMWLAVVTPWAAAAVLGIATFVFQGDNIELERKVESAKAETHAAQREYEQLNEQLTGEVLTLSGNNKQLAAEVTKLTGEMKTLAGEKSELGAKTDALIASVKGLEAKVKATEVQATAAARERDQSRKEGKGLSDRILAMRKELESSNRAAADAKKQLAVLEKEKTKMETALAGAGKTIEERIKQELSLMVELKALSAAMAKSNLKIRDLKSTINDQYAAFIVWDDDRKKGLLRVSNLPRLDDAHDYQLWVVDPNQKDPVDGGTFDVDENGFVEFQIEPKQPLKAVTAFAITREVKGGVKVSTQPHLLAAANK